MLQLVVSRAKKHKRQAIASMLPMSAFARRKSRLLKCTIKGLPTSVRSLINRSDRPTLLLNHAEAMAELQSKNFAQEMNYFNSEITEVLGHLRSERSAKIEADAKSRSLADELHRLNQQIQKDAPQGPTQLPMSSNGPLEYHMGSPPGLEPQEPKTRIPEGGSPDDDDNDDEDDDDDDKRRKDKKSKKDKKRKKKKKRDSSASSSSSSIPREPRKLFSRR